MGRFPYSSLCLCPSHNGELSLQGFCVFAPPTKVRSLYGNLCLRPSIMGASPHSSFCLCPSHHGGISPQ
ncbi:unnamed protein product [Staurois parvus]|uniref:Uncharacterized protein n=1 Tax=Staurois parvus TaxID=386267 RepID=A0ABN9E880_9NEOB|nr:unnamed protein product [Staurois parvus]